MLAFIDVLKKEQDKIKKTVAIKATNIGLKPVSGSGLVCVRKEREKLLEGLKRASKDELGGNGYIQTLRVIAIMDNVDKYAEMSSK